MDVCKYFDTGNTSSMRYNDTVKKFWRLGYGLFHRKWLRFMSGSKHMGTLLTRDCEEGIFPPVDDSINFAVPERKIVSSELSPVNPSDIKPGILQYLLNKVTSQSSETKTYKICLDGKKINAATDGKCSDIDLWGFEAKPTLEEKQQQLSLEMKDIAVATEMVKLAITKHKQYLLDINTEDQKVLKEILIQIVRDLSTRIKTLRETAVRKQMLKERLQNTVDGDWRKSKLVFVISALLTALFDVKACIRHLLANIDNLCSLIAILNNENYKRGGLLQLQNQNNYVHLVENHNKATESQQDYRYIKQLSEQWHKLRKTAFATGSTLNTAIGLSTLKEQLQHFEEKLFKKPKPEPSSAVKEKMNYGNENELNAVATLVAKVLPVFNPGLKYVEEGCYQISDSETGLIVSPDGSCRKSPDDTPVLGIEIKCPFPGKLFTTPIQYNLPKYYVAQVLAEMKALNTDKLYFMSYSTESTAVHEVTFDSELWEMMYSEFVHVYGGSKPTRPSRNSPSLSEIQSRIESFLKANVFFIAEIPSIQGIHYNIQSPKSNVFCNHDSDETFSSNNQTLLSVQEILYDTECNLKKAYSLNRSRASEFLGFMISDLDRFYHKEQFHAVPIAYGLKGYSMPTYMLRNMLEYVLQECANRGLYVPVCSFDGQWYKLVVRDSHNIPLTLLQLQKDVYSEVKKMTKAEQIKFIASKNIVDLKVGADILDASKIICIDKTKRVESVDGNKKNVNTGIIMVNGHKNNPPGNMTNYVYRLIKNNAKIGDNSEKEQQKEVDILSELPASVTEDLSEDLQEEIQNIGDITTAMPNTSTEAIQNPDMHLLFDSSVSSTQNAYDNNSMDIDQPPKDHTTNPPETNIDKEDMKLMLNALQVDGKTYKGNKWNITLYEFESKLSNAQSIDDSFYAYELKILLTPIIGKLKAGGAKVNLSTPKTVLINMVSELFGDGSKISLPKRKRKTHKVSKLTVLAKQALQKVPKEYINIIIAEHIFPSALSKWYNDSPNGSHINIAPLDLTGTKLWYRRPEYNINLGHYIFMILDVYHQLCGIRRLVCANGIPTASVSKDAFVRIAENSEQNGCGLNTALVKDLIDRQSVAYAVQTFAASVEDALTNIGAIKEAEFCRLIRDWYRAEDEPGIPALERCQYRLKLREWLLKDVNFGRFPPYGSHVKDIPVILYEGLLTGIERRLQLSPLTKTGNYNVRSLGSLDIENFFGGFQDIDPRGTGVLRPDDISTALSVAVELTEARMDPDRGFNMVTSSAKIYPCNEFSRSETQPSFKNDIRPFRDISRITVKDHHFDSEERKRGTQKRKLGNISKPMEPVRKPQTVREFHRAHEGKILPHVRRGLSLEDLN